MTSFHGLQTPQKTISLPLPRLCLFYSRALLRTPFSTFSTSLFPSLLLLLEEAAGLLSARAGAPGGRSQHGRRGVAFGCVEVCVNGQPFKQQRRSLGSVWPWLPSHLLDFIYACYLLSDRRQE